MAKKKIGGLGKGLGAIFIENETENPDSTVTLKISEIEPNINQPRREFDEEALAQLAESIKQHGLIQPILVRPILGGGYQIVAGERRYRACQLAGITEIPVSIRELTEQELAPSSDDTAFSTLAEHAAQLIPPTSNCLIKSPHKLLQSVHKLVDNLVLALSYIIRNAGVNMT